MKKAVIVGIIILVVVFIALAVRKVSPPEDDKMPPNVQPGTVKVDNKKNDTLWLSDSLQTRISEGTMKKFNTVMNKARNNNWDTLSIGDLMGKLGLEFLGVPYASASLDTPGQEVCVIDLSGLDCVTFFENVLNMARIIKQDNLNMDAMARATEETRYRDGALQGYVSRLHYTADWIHDNIEKGIIKDVTKEIRGKELNFNVGFMSENPHLYSGLKGDEEAVEKMKEYEEDINDRTYHYIPKNEVKDAEQFLQTGDIIAITTNMKGLDYSHTGMIYKDDNGRARFLHASQTGKKVVLDQEISKYLSGIKKHTGISVLRPIEP